MGGSPGDVSEEPVTYEKRKKGWGMSCNVGKATERLENEVLLILQPFRRFTYITSHSTALLSLYLRHSSFFNPLRRFTYVTAHSLTFPSLHIRDSSFSNPFQRITYVKAHSPTSSVASPTPHIII